jgi:hypothetical protein
VRNLGWAHGCPSPAIMSTMLAMLFVAFDHGAIISKTTGREKSRIIRFVVGNPLIMKEMA